MRKENLKKQRLEIWGTKFFCFSYNSHTERKIMGLDLLSHLDHRVGSP